MSGADEPAQQSPGPRAVVEVRHLLDRAVAAYAAAPGAGAAEAVGTLERRLAGLDAPLRVALAGKLKAGKSTLLNALLGVELAASDHAECTRVLTWYRWTRTPSVTVHPVDGAPWSSPPRRGPGGLEIDLRGRPAPQIDRIEVGWPAPGLRRTTLVDTPGLDSLSRDVSERTRAFLTGDDGEPADGEPVVDAVVYLLRHLHATDVRFLESFGAGRGARGAAPGTVAVLSRADEVGVGRIDAMIASGRVAERYRGEASLRPLVQTVVPVAGLLAVTGQTLREDEVADLRALARLDRTVTDGLLLSVDRFRRPSLDLPVPAAARAALLSRFGLFGVRLALTLLRTQDLPAPVLAGELERRSGLTELRRVLDAQLTARRDVLRAQGAVLALTRLLDEHPVPGGRELAAECERLTLAGHGVRELELLRALRTPGLALPADALAAAERLLGAQGDRPTDRLALPPDAEPDRVAEAARRAREEWLERGRHPLADRETRRACRLVVRTCEALLEPVSVAAPGRA
ncbi:GTPase [uncultured Cellulomonas sp.]|uniref:GTPase n=1 Tax=uncultured Cellulomonas sp. TaxID=189682 RepID=UPI00261BB4AE|nr:GTPase [uncultured Cellulomonas sp.]